MTTPWSNRSTTYTEISLHGQIQHARHDQLSRILAGVTAMPPQRIVERHLIYKPIRGPVQQTTQIGGSQAVQDAAKRAAQKSRGETGDVFYLRLVQKVARKETIEAEAPGGDGMNEAGGGTIELQNEAETLKMQEVRMNRSTWSLRLFGLPEAGKRAATVRGVTTEDLHVENAIEFVKEAGYSFVSEYIVEGHQFVQGNTVLLLHRILQCPSLLTTAANTSSNALLQPLESIPALSSCTPFDGSDAYVLEASVRVQDGRQPESMSRGTQELMGFREMMRGIVDLRVVDRLALDTRVK